MSVAELALESPAILDHAPPIYHTPRHDAVGVHVIRAHDAVTMVTDYSREGRSLVWSLLTEDERTRFIHQLGDETFLLWLGAPLVHAHQVPGAARWPTWFYETEDATPAHTLMLAI
jgi:hypothetical protein